MKKTLLHVRFVSRMQAGCCITFAVFAMLCFVGMFFNLSHIFTFVMSAVLSIAIYLEKKW